LVANSIEKFSLDTTSGRLNPTKPVGIDNYFCRKIIVNVHFFSVECNKLFIEVASLNSSRIKV
jgi:hypothetical protein